MKDFHKDFNSEEKRKLRKEFDNSSEVRRLRRDFNQATAANFIVISFLILINPKLLSIQDSAIFILLLIVWAIEFIITIRQSKKIEKAHLEDYTKWLKDKNIKY